MEVFMCGQEILVSMFRLVLPTIVGLSGGFGSVLGRVVVGTKFIKKLPKLLNQGGELSIVVPVLLPIVVVKPKEVSK